MVKQLCFLGFGLFVVSSASAQTASFLSAPADPNQPTRALRYVPVTEGIKKFDVVEPKDWRELNRAVGPKSGSNGTMGGMSMGGGKRDTGAK
jgi:hypothetical protein